jgi:hypothetical protein
MRLPSHTTVVAYLALFAAVATVGMMERSKPGNVASDPFTDTPITYDTLGDGAFPEDAFNLARGVFVAPASGSYVLTGQVDWVDPNGHGRDMRFVTLNSDGSPRSVLLSALSGPGGDRIQPINGTVRLKQGDVVQLTVANGGDNGDFSYAQMNITFVSG